MKDHWLSQFYLRNFAIPGWTKSRNARIWQTDLQQGNCTKKKIGDIAQELHFYSFKNSDGQPCRRVDNALTLLENKASLAYAQLLEGATDLNKTPLMKRIVALFLATTLLRTPSQEK